MEAENEAAAWCEDEWGVAAWDTFVTDRKCIFFCCCCPMTLSWPEISVYLCTLVSNLEGERNLIRKLIKLSETGNKWSIVPAVYTMSHN